MGKNVPLDVPEEKEVFWAMVEGFAAQGLTLQAISEKFGYNKSWLSKRISRAGKKWKEMKVPQVPPNRQKVPRSSHKKRKQVPQSAPVEEKVPTDGNFAKGKSPSSYQIIDEQTLEQYVLQLANTGEPDVRVASLMKDILKEKKAFNEEKAGVTELEAQALQALMSDFDGDVGSDVRKEDSYVS